MLGSRVKEEVLEARGLPFVQALAMQEYLLSNVETFELDEMVEDVAGSFAPAEKVSSEIESMMNEYDEEAFWSELETRLGQRDFYATLDPAERKDLETEGDKWLPEEVHEYCEKYAQEFDTHGLDRLRIQK